MIVSLGLGDEGVQVCLDDGIAEFNPIRGVEMCNMARKLFAQSVIDTMVALEPETGPQEAPDAVEQ